MPSKRKNGKREELSRTTASSKFQLVSIIIVLLQSFSFSLALDNNACVDKPFGTIFEDLEDCTSYYECLFGELNHETCPTGQRFDIIAATCVNGKCPPCKCESETTTVSSTTATEEPTSSSTETTTSTESTSLSTEGPSSTGTSPSAPGTECSNEPYCQASEHGTVHRDRYDCSKYYVCWEGEAVAHTCKNGKYFDENINACNFASIVSCTPNENCTPKPTESSSSAPSTETPTTTQSSSSESTTLTESSSTSPTEDPSSTTSLAPGTECSNEPYCQPTEHGTFHRDRIDCNKYYVCRNGEAVAHTCDSGMYFDDVSHVCNFQSLVSCSPCTPKPTACSTEPNCKLFENFSLHRDKKDCRKYYVCLEGSPVLLLCSPGDYFDEAQELCKPESDVKCTSSVDENCESTSDLTTTAQPSCPPEPDCEVEPQGSIFRDPRDCAKFYFCRNGKAVARSCTAGKLFDLNTNACRLPSFVDCTPNENCPLIDPSSTPTSIPSPSPSPSPSPTPSPTPSSTTMVPDGQVDPNITDCINQPNGKVFRHSAHCSVFYVCRDQKAVKHSCRYHQWFDDQVVVCNFRNLVDCPSGID